MTHLRHPLRRSRNLSALGKLVLLCSVLMVWLGASPALAEPDAPMMTPNAPARKAYAVIIGNNQSLADRRPDLHYADDDAARYYEILETMAPGRVSLLASVDRDTQRLFPRAQQRAIAPTRAALEGIGKALAADVAAANAAGNQTELYFVFAGHGDVDQGEGYLELADARFRSRDLEAWLRAIPFTRAHVILDSCNSFFMLGVRKPGGRHFATSEDAARALSSRLQNVGVFLSTSAEGEAFEWSEIQSGIFSYVVRSGLLGAADANADGSVSYLELAAFVDTATANVRNPNMRPHVFARGPGAKDQTAIAHLQNLSGVRRLELSAAEPQRLRLRDADDVPILDAHAEKNTVLRVALPVAWATSATLERAAHGAGTFTAGAPRLPAQLFALPAEANPVTLALLEPIERRGLGRGPDETFERLFDQPFGPSAVARYVSDVRSRPPMVYGVSKQDAERMLLLLDGIARTQRNARWRDSIGGIGFGSLMVTGGIGILRGIPDISSDNRTNAKITGWFLTGVGGVMAISSVAQLAGTRSGEDSAKEFRRAIARGVDTSQAYAEADRRLQEMLDDRQSDRVSGGVIGGLAFVISGTGFVMSEFEPASRSQRNNRRLAWGAGAVFGAMLLGESVLGETPAETLTEIWREDPSLDRYQTDIAVSSEGAFVNFSAQF